MSLINHSLSKVHTVAFKGIEAILVEVQVYIGNEMPSFTICGLGDKAVSESKDRIKSALKCIGLALPAKRIVVNLSPANIPKEGSHYDLAIALGILKAQDVVHTEELDQLICIGELALNGDLVPVNGALIAAMEAHEKKMGLICPLSCGDEAALSGEIKIIAAKNLLEVVQVLRGDRVISQPKPKIMYQRNTEYDFQNIIGNQSAKRAIEIAMIGRYHILLIGSPGAGKSTLCSAINSIQMPMLLEEALEVSQIYSAAGLLKDGLITSRPLRNPHHTASTPSILGGGRLSRPGEISLAHKGVLFLDELTLWPSSILNGLRESLETGEISIARADAVVKYPADYQLIAAMNPCPCGKAFDKNPNCSKLPFCMKNYLKRIPGPILDRISIIIKVDQISPWDFSNTNNQEESSQIIFNRIMEIREFAKNTKNEIIYLDDGISFLNRFAEVNNLSIRKYKNVKNIAKTIAMSRKSTDVTQLDIKESISYVGTWLTE